MNTRYTPLVKLKKNEMDKQERVVQRSSADVDSASRALEESYSSLDEIAPPSSGKMNDFMVSRTLLESQRDLINHNKQWLRYAQNQLLQDKENLKKSMIEYEKYKYLELEEIKKILKEQKIKEAKDLDEIALMTFGNKEKN